MLYQAAEHYQPGEDPGEPIDSCESLDRLYSEMNTGNLWVEEEVCHQELMLTNY